MTKSTFFKAIFSLLLIFAATTIVSCNDDKDPNNGGNDGGEEPTAAYIRVAPETLTFDHTGTPVGSDGRFTVESNTTWSVAVEAGKEWLQLSATTGSNNGTIAITIPAPIAAGDRAELTFTTTNTDGAIATKKVAVVQTAAQTPEPPTGDVKITVDFGQGATIASPELPPYTKDNFVTGRHQYTIGGYVFAIFADQAESGKFYWIDNTQFNPSQPTPNKGLFFSKLGAYIEFPAIAGKTLSKVSYLPTTSQNDVKLDVLNSDNGDVQYSLDFAEDGSSVYTLIEAAANTPYRIVVINTKNAQCARLELSYTDAQ